MLYVSVILNVVLVVLALEHRHERRAFRREVDALHLGELLRSRRNGRPAEPIICHDEGEE